ncbi:hypothetical protein APUTEX25_002127 [Auxenochlorella protothecoides]|uniref:Uncharacterized protein n=1 Tax=Auxenochlorella protothecoides TaxID=3075 RepID=A0A3M7KZ38_AUXPR|nr:hypothetical protein APUTEX25_002127 [Auxenochlorella protothecoides]|eukprot:RMZ54552.1 hypothetical protein APUTEX25_002127 [Auxenochlorella protothecoides]
MADVGVLNTAFAAVTAFQLLLAQPSVCRAHWSFTPYETLRQRDESILRYTNLVEIMAPIFDMDFFDELVRLTLYNAHYGWGLDWIWPDLLGYPSDKIAVIDEVFAGQGAKWRLAWRFTLHSDWQLIRKAYKTISFIDDDLEVAGGEVLNTALAVFEAFDLLIAQPSVCNEPGSWTPYRALFTVRSMVLRYVNMVEIMAPIFEMELFDRMVRPTLFDAYFGWGLDWLWPALLSYPPDKVAVIDEVCVYHPKTDRKNSALYKLEAPMTAREEANLHITEWGWSPEGRAVRGFSSYSCDVISEVARPSPIAAPNLSNFLPGNNTMPSIVAGGIKHWLTRKEPFRLSSLNQLGLLVRTIPVFIVGAGIASVMLYRKKRRSVKRKITLG